MPQSLQQLYAPTSVCFGCGPANPEGLRIASFVRGDECVCEFVPEPHHEAFEGFVAGGIIGAVHDCPRTWTAAHHLLTAKGLDHVPCTVTLEYGVKFSKPTPSNGPLLFRARVVKAGDRSAEIEGTLEVEGETTATCRAVFVEVKEGHPAFQRW